MGDKPPLGSTKPKAVLGFNPRPVRTNEQYHNLSRSWNYMIEYCHQHTNWWWRMDWVGILRELRILATQLQTDRFYALYLLLAVLVVAYLIRKY